MEINIMFDTSGKFLVEKSDDMGAFMAVGMLEMAKKLFLDPAEVVDEETEEDIEGQIELDIEPTNEV